MLNQNFGDHSFKDDCEQETAMTQDMDRYQLGIAKLVPRYDNALVVRRTMWNAVGW